MDFDNALYEADLEGETRGYDREYSRAYARGYAKSEYRIVMTLINKKGFTLESALDLLDITKERWSEVKSILSENQEQPVSDRYHSLIVIYTV